MRVIIPLLIATAVCLLCALLLPILAARSPEATERIYSNGIFPAVGSLWTVLMGFVPVSAAELLLYALALTAAALVLWGVVLLLRRKWKTVLIGFLTLCLIASALFARFYVAWGFNYFRLPLSARLSLDVKKRSPQELADLCVSLAKQAAALRAGLSESGDGSVDLGTTDEIFAAVPSAFDRLHEKFPQLSRVAAKPKGVLYSKGMSYAGISGIFMPFTFECNVNVDQPTMLLPVTAAHEAVHQTGIAREDEANFIGYLACMAADDAKFNYSATMLALIHAGNALNRISTQAYSTLCAKCYSAGMKRDFDAHNAYWKKFEGPVQESVTKTNDRYLKSNGQSDGVLSYGRMVDLLLAARAAGIIK